MNNLKTLMVGAVLSCATSLFAQETKQQVVENVTRLDVLAPGISFERKLGKQSTVLVKGGFSPYVSYSYSDFLGSNFEAALEPTVAVQYRVYYNHRQRVANEKRWERNSMNYLAPVLGVLFSSRPFGAETLNEEKRRPVGSLGAVWGIQRNFPKHFSIDFNAGLGYQFARSTKLDASGKSYKATIAQPTFLGQLTLGFWLNRKRPVNS